MAILALFVSGNVPLKSGFCLYIVQCGSTGYVVLKRIYIGRTNTLINQCITNLFFLKIFLFNFKLRHILSDAFLILRLVFYGTGDEGYAGQ